MKRTLPTMVLIAGVALCALAPWPGLWLSDLLAAVAPWIAVAAAALGAGLAPTRLRRWSALPLTLACSAALLTWLAPRAPRAPAAGAGETISVLIFNSHAAPLEETLDFLRQHPADVAVLVEAPWNLFDSTAADAGYHWRLALGPRTGGPAVRAALSRWDGEVIESGLPDQGVFAVRFDTPHGPIAVVVAQPLSPRTPARWREGNRRTRQAARLGARAQESGAATLIAGDFNSPPTGWRNRMLGRAGFRRARPLWPPAGSYPAWLPEFAGLAIDGVAVGERLSVASWRLLETPSSDHRAVLVELAVNAQ